MSDPTYDGAEGRPPGYSEGPPDDEAQMTEAQRTADRLDRQNEPAGDPNALYGPGREAVAATENRDASDPQ